MSAQNIYQAYTYFIKWSILDRSYYGVRYTQELNKRSPEEDFWDVYKTSSEVVKDFIKENGEPDIKCIDRKFDTPDEAREYERAVLKTNNVISDDRWLNQSYGDWGLFVAKGEDHHAYNKTWEEMYGYDRAQKMKENLKRVTAGENNGMYGKEQSPETKQKISKANKGKKRTEEYKKMKSQKSKGEGNPMYGKEQSFETKQKISKANKGKLAGERHHMYGKSHSSETRQKISEAVSGERSPCFTGYYITPWGVYANPREAQENCPKSIGARPIKTYCQNNQKIVTKFTIIRSTYLTTDMLGKTFEELGFGFKQI